MRTGQIVSHHLDKATPGEAIALHAPLPTPTRYGAGRENRAKLPVIRQIATGSKHVAFTCTRIEESKN